MGARFLKTQNTLIFSHILRIMEKEKLTGKTKEEKEETILMELDKKAFEIIYNCLNQELARYQRGNEERKKIWDVFEKFYACFEDMKNELPTIQRP